MESCHVYKEVLWKDGIDAAGRNVELIEFLDEDLWNGVISVSQHSAGAEGSQMILS